VIRTPYHTRTLVTLLAASLLAAPVSVAAQAGTRSGGRPAVEVLGRDFTFPNRIDGLPARLSDFEGLKVGSFVTSDGVRLTYWEAGQGRPLVMLPGWSGNGAQHVNLLYLLGRRYRVFVLDPRNQGLSQKVAYGTRIARLAKDLHEFNAHVGLRSADYVGHSMGAAVLWSYLDQFGGAGVRKVVFVDQPVSIYAHRDWSEQERRDAGANFTSGEQLVAALTEMFKDGNMGPPPPEMAELLGVPATPYSQNSDSLGRAFVRNDIRYMNRVLFDHAMNDWRDVIRHKVTMPTAIFSGEASGNLSAQRWIHSVVPGSALYVYTNAEYGDHELMFKNPVKFAADLAAFLER
jgi:non-heme chloroperoxidase